VEEVHGRNQDVGRLKTAFGWSMCEIKSGRNHLMRSSVRGTKRLGISCARGGTR
jgi:hypothetical protein